MSWNLRFYKYKWFEDHSKALEGLEFDDLVRRAEGGDDELSTLRVEGWILELALQEALR
jgi:hypothetical protein